MTTRRERLERKLEKREDWAGKASERASKRFNAAHAIADGIPFGQPILVGHHSEKHARADAARIDNNMRKGCEENNLATHHRSRAAGLARQLDNSIFSDDDNAIAALEARIAEREAERDRCKLINKEIRKGAGWESRLDPPLIESEKTSLIQNARIWGVQGYPAYVLTNLGACIRKDRERIEEIKARAKRTEQAEAAGGVIIEGNEYVRVTFAEKPDRSILNDLKAAGFYWGSGSWNGKRSSIPECVLALI